MKYGMQNHYNPKTTLRQHFISNNFGIIFLNISLNERSFERGPTDIHGEACRVFFNIGFQETFT